MDDIEALVRAARPASGSRDRDLSERAERDLDAIMATPSAERAPSPRRRQRSARSRKRRFGAVLLIAAVALCAAVGLGALLDDAAQVPREIAQPAAPDPSRVLSAAAEKLDESSGQSESATMVPQLADSEAVIAWLTSGAATRQDQAEWLSELADGSAATGAERGGDGTWRVSVAGMILVIRADSGEIAAVVDTGGETHEVAPAM